MDGVGLVNLEGRRDVLHAVGWTHEGDRLYWEQPVIEKILRHLGLSQTHEAKRSRSRKCRHTK